ncbi:MAG: peptidoglycan recognition protein family protein [bacterium]|nr:peptidoglycan recognition protein family protein [bacterium]
MRKINKIIIHCTDSEFGDAHLVNDLHTGQENPLIPLAWPSGTEIYFQNPFRKIGYHYLILNGFIRPGEYQANLDGYIETGRSEEEEGAHCYGQNQDSLGVCLVGRRLFSAKQLYQSLPDLLTRLCKKHSLCWQDIYAHYEFNQLKSCPNIDIELIRKILTRGY